MALLTHRDPERQAAGLKLMEKHVCAVAWCEQGCDESRAMAARCMLKSQLMDWAARQGESTNFESISDVFREFLTGMWSGGLQTIINERMSQKIRDLEERQTPSKQRQGL